jgi:hypothetical protein
MKYLIALLLLVSISCTQEGMSDEQRAKLKEEKASRKIQRVTDADILVAAKTKAVQVYIQAMEEETSTDHIKWIGLHDSTASPYEQQMQEAYQYALDKGLSSYDNIEDLGKGEIVFTRPDQRYDSVAGFWLITLDKKEIIKALQ